MDREILLKVDFVHASKRTKEIAQSGPQAFVGVDVNLADAVAILVSRPFALARCMADRDVGTRGRGQPPVGPPFVGVDRGSVLGGFQHTGLKVRSRTVFLRSTGSGRFPGQRSPGPEDGRAPTCHDPVPDWRGGAAGPRDRGAGRLSRRHFGTFHPLPRPGRVTGSDHKPGRQAPVWCGVAPANACGQYPVPVPSAASGCLGQSPARCARSRYSGDGSLARASRPRRCKSARKRSENTPPARDPADAPSTVQPASCTRGNPGHPDAGSRLGNRNISAHPSTRPLRNGSSVPPTVCAYHEDPILYQKDSAVEVHIFRPMSQEY